MFLEERLMSIDEMAQWFGISKKSYQNHNKRKLEELKFYCDFEVVPRKGIKINKIYNAEYVVYEKKSSFNYNIVKEEFPKQWNINKIDQCSNVAIKIKNARPELTTADSTTYSYTTRAKREYVKEGRFIQQPCLVKKIGDNGRATYEKFNDEERKIVDKYRQLYFKKSTEMQLLIQDQHQKGEITSEEAMEQIAIVTGFTPNRWLEYIGTISEAIGCEVVRATYLEECGWVEV